jgi:hypothetical protein
LKHNFNGTGNLNEKVEKKLCVSAGAERNLNSCEDGKVTILIYMGGKESEYL